MNKKDLSSIRKQLLEILNNEPRPLATVAKEMGISKAALFRFIKSAHDFDAKHANKLEDWIQQLCHPLDTDE